MPEQTYSAQDWFPHEYTFTSCSSDFSEASWPREFNIPSNTKSVHVQLGPNLNPIEAPDANTFIVLVDASPCVVADLHQRYCGQANVAVVWSAISNYTGFAKLHLHKDGPCSFANSLSVPTYGRHHYVDKGDWFSLRNYRGEIDVPVHRLAEILEKLPLSLPIALLETNIEGFDFQAIKSAGTSLRRVRSIMAEVDCDGKPSYAGTTNERKHIEPYLSEQGFIPITCETAPDIGVIVDLDANMHLLLRRNRRVDACKRSDFMYCFFSRSPVRVRDNFTSVNAVQVKYKPVARLRTRAKHAARASWSLRRALEKMVDMEHVSFKGMNDNITAFEPVVNSRKLYDHAPCNVFGMEHGRLRTREDVVINATANAEQPQGLCSLAYLLPDHYLWLHVPKCASTWIIEHLLVDQEHDRLINTEFPRGTNRDARLAVEDSKYIPTLHYEALKPFAIVREPTARLLSAYATILDRGLKNACWRRTLPFLNETDAKERFLGFLRALRDIGTRAFGACPGSCVWHHALSQSFFLFRAVGLPAVHTGNIVHLENFRQELPRVLNISEVERLPSSVYQEKINARSGKPAVPSYLLELPGVLPFIVEYYRQDYACLGYPVPNLNDSEATLWRI